MVDEIYDGCLITQRGFYKIPKIHKVVDAIEVVRFDLHSDVFDKTAIAGLYKIYDVKTGKQYLSDFRAFMLPGILQYIKISKIEIEQLKYFSRIKNIIDDVIQTLEFFEKSENAKRIKEILFNKGDSND